MIHILVSGSHIRVKTARSVDSDAQNQEKAGDSEPRRTAARRIPRGHSCRVGTRCATAGSSGSGRSGRTSCPARSGGTGTAPSPCRSSPRVGPSRTRCSHNLQRARTHRCFTGAMLTTKSRKVQEAQVSLRQVHFIANAVALLPSGAI